MTTQQLMTPPKPHNAFFYLTGLGVLCVNKLRYAVRGYREPRPFAPTEYKRAIAYDKNVVTNWLEALRNYTGETIDQKVVLELGPGADLGPALFLLDNGAKQYITIDANRLIDQTPTVFYEELTKTLTHGSEIKSQLEKTLSNQDDRIRYLVDPKFDITVLRNEKVDVVVSQAAFEHFSDVDQTVRQLSSVVKSGGVIVAEIDLLTHTGAIRSRDPLNIYRYADFLYRLCRYSGIPNRLRPNDYKNIFEKNGWHDVKITPLQQLSAEYTMQVQKSLASKFRHEDAQMHILTIQLCATKD